MHFVGGVVYVKLGGLDWVEKAVLKGAGDGQDID